MSVHHPDLTILTNFRTVAATEADVKAKDMKKALAESKFKSQHLWAKEPTKEQVMKRIAQWSDKIKKMEVNIKHKDDNKEVSLGTSKVRRTRSVLIKVALRARKLTITNVASAQLHGSTNFSCLVQKKRGADREGLLQDIARQI